MFKRFEIKDYLKILIAIATIAIIAVSSKYIGILDLLSKLIKSLFPIFFAISISFINEPLIRKLEKRIKRKFSVIIIYVVEVVLIGLIILLIIPSLVEQLKKFFVELPVVYDTVMSKLNYIDLNLDLKSTINSYSNEILGALSNVITLLFDVGIAYVGGFFLSFDYLKFKERIKEFLRKKNKEKMITYIKSFSPFVYKYTYCLLIDMIILWIITGVSFLLAGLEYPFMFATIIAISDLIPYIGPIVGGAPAVIVALTISSKFATFILIIIILAQFVENNITKPYIMKNAIELHPLEGLIGITVGGVLLGFLGLILSPIIITGIKIYINLKKEEKI